MTSSGRIWVVHPNAVLRRGIVACLEGAAQPVAGAGGRLRPVLDLSDVAVLLFDVEGPGADRAAAFARDRGIRLIGLVGESNPDRLRDLQRAGMCAVLGTNALSPARVVECVRAVQRLPAPSRPRRATPGPAPHGAQRCTPREIDVLRLLADGATTRDIARRMNYSERTVKSIVHDARIKLRGRTRAHAVAVAARSGVI